MAGREFEGDLATMQGAVAAAGIEPLFPVNPNPMMVHDFGFYCMNTLELPRRFESPGVLPSLGDVSETQEGFLRMNTLRCIHAQSASLVIDLSHGPILVNPQGKHG